MSSGSPPPDRGGGLATTLLLGFAIGTFGFLGGLPIVVGPALGVGGVVASAFLRGSRPERLGTVGLVPVLAAAVLLAVTAPPVPSTELFAGLTGLALLLWIADDPARPSRGGRRAVPIIALGALGVGLAWTITLAFPGRSPDIALAGGLLAAALVLIAFLFARLPRLALGPVRNA